MIGNSLSKINKNFSFENVAEKINLIFKDTPNVIKKYIFDIRNVIVKDSKIKLDDVLFYKFLYSVPESTKVSIVSSFNFNNDSSITRSAYAYRDEQIPLEFYNHLYEQISNCYKQLMNIDDKKPFMFAVDGSFNNTNSKNTKDVLETSLNMGYYDITNDCPIELNLEGTKSKNNELHILKKYITKSNIPKNSIIVLDRAYCSYEFINFLIKKNLKFIIRFRNNCKNFDKIKNINDIRVLKYFDEFTNKVPYEKYIKYIEKNNKKIKGKHKLIDTQNNKIVDIKDIPKFKNAILKMKYEYTLLTNLSLNNYDDNKIKELYKQRWDIEVFFKLLKYNFKFEILKEHNQTQSTEQYKKLYMVNLIAIYLGKIIEKTYYYNNEIKKDYVKKEKNKLIKYVCKPNKSNIIKGVYKIIESIIKASLKKDDLKKTCNSYVSYSYVKLGEHKERKAKTPFLKWYVKGHSNRSLLCKLVEAYLNDNLSKLNKNHKVLYNLCTIKFVK